MRHAQATLHVTKETKLSIPIEVELEAANSSVADGHRVFIVGFVSNKTCIQRDTGCLLEQLRYCFNSGMETEFHAILSPWKLRDDFLREDAVLRRCSAGVPIKKVGRGKTANLVGVRAEDNPIHSWAIGPHGVAGGYVLTSETKSRNPDDLPLNSAERLLDQECSGWRALIRDALTRDYSEWGQLASEHPTAWVRELSMPLPFTIEAKAGAPTARIVCQSLLDVLVLTTQLDGIRGLRHRICKSVDCGKLFLIGNYEHKIYCDYVCAHREAVRDGRKRKRKVLENSTNKPKKTETSKGRKK